MYWEQVGVNLQDGGNNGEMRYWYTKIGKMAIFFITSFNFWLFVY
ncbi:hypothetical protein ADIS_3186 [Lunatimonas lonarensis]|uniref:Uncharacterized protein n=1 Tax=Lunatimonas lonarensis TaxID=1232681 RepID=R7ZPR1_9BACT|nr:hypothetical protein ADIS_3186 [Lunatimonas lonarensis]